MRIAVFGATGGTGFQVVGQALSAGHEVVAVVRAPSRLPLRHENLRVHEADVTDPSEIADALRGADAAISALGARDKAGVGIVSAGTRGIVKAAEAAGVRRILVVSAAPVGEPVEGDTLVYRRVMLPVIRRAFGSSYADAAVMEQLLRESGLDWTVVRPPRLNDKSATGRYRRAIGQNVVRGYKISRADVADALLTAVDDPATVRRVVGVAD